MPIGTLIAFSILFVLFALNLFGLFEIKLPQRLVHRLDRAQAMQQEVVWSVLRALWA